MTDSRWGPMSGTDAVLEDLLDKLLGETCPHDSAPTKSLCRRCLRIAFLAWGPFAAWQMLGEGSGHAPASAERRAEPHPE